MAPALFGNRDDLRIAIGRVQPNLISADRIDGMKSGLLSGQEKPGVRADKRKCGLTRPKGSVQPYRRRQLYGVGGAQRMGLYHFTGELNNRCVYLGDLILHRKMKAQQIKLARQCRFLDGSLALPTAQSTQDLDPRQP